MEAEIGQFSLVLALVISLAQAIIPLIGAHRRNLGMITFANYTAVAQFMLIALAFSCLTYGFVTSDFSMLIVTMNSNSMMPTLYKVTAVWGNHEGSLLLWILILTLFGAAVALTGRNLPLTLKARVLSIQSAISFGFLALVIFTSNPFERMSPAALDGQELNPLLQDIGLAIHPPFLYLGYVGFSITFAFAVAALIEGRIDASWARFVRPWVLAAWCFLTIGITLGSYWAYYELGWGGWWFWDPVENASFMPWLVGTALLHSALVMERRQALVVWTLLLAIMTFSLSLIGTFIVRSGVLTSVHAFTSDPARGMGVLLLLLLTTGGALTLFAMRSQKFSHPVVFKIVSREGGLVLNNIILLTAAGTVFLGTFYPLFVEMVGPDKISVGAPYFNQTFVPLMIPLLLAVVIGPFLRWKRDTLWAAFQRARTPAILSIAIMLIIAVSGGGKYILAAGGLGIALWLVFGSITILTQRIKLFQAPFSRSLSLAKNTPRSVYGMILAHLGLGLAVAGITCVSAWEQERIVVMAPNEQVEIAGYMVQMQKVDLIQGANFQAERGTFKITKAGREIAVMTSERRFFTVSQRVTTEAGIKMRDLNNLYLAIGEPNDNGQWVVRIYFHPLALLIWIGPLIMAFGGFVSLSDRRFRVGAPKRAAGIAPLAEGVKG